MAKAVIFDMYETLVTLWHTTPYMGAKMAEEAGIEERKFREIWDTSDRDRSLGIRTTEDVLEEILKVNEVYSKELFDKIIGKRRLSKDEVYDHLHEEIIPMLEALKASGIKIGLISNCFNEESDSIRKSPLYKYFDVMCLSCEVRLQKPDPMIYTLCLDRLGLEAEDCIYCGDGGSHELEAAKELNFRPVQALWYLKDNTGQPSKRKPEFVGVNKPMDIVKIAIL